MLGEKREFHEHNRPYRQHSTEHHNSALLIYGGKDTARVVKGTECIAVEDIDIIEHKSVNRNNYRDKREHHSLKLIFWHNIILSHKYKDTKTRANLIKIQCSVIQNTMYRNQIYARQRYMCRFVSVLFYHKTNLIVKFRHKKKTDAKAPVLKFSYVPNYSANIFLALLRNEI